MRSYVRSTISINPSLLCVRSTISINPSRYGVVADLFLSLSLSLLMCCSSFGNVFVGVLSTVFIYPSLYCVNLIFYSLSLSLSLYVLFRSCSCSFSSSSSFDRIYPSVSLSCHTVSFSPSLRTVLIFFLLFFFFVVVVLLPMILLFLLRTVE